MNEQHSAGISIGQFRIDYHHLKASHDNIYIFIYLHSCLDGDGDDDCLWSRKHQSNNVMWWTNQMTRWSRFIVLRCNNIRR